MHFLDFISDSPKNYIFHKGSNKTNLGGIISLIYLIILLLIFIGYLYDYFVNNSYEFTSYYKYINETDMQNEENKEEFNPMINFMFFIYNATGKKVNDSELKKFNENFVFCKYDKFFESTEKYICEELEPFGNYTQRVKDIKIVIGYRCKTNDDGVKECLPEEEEEEYYNYHPLLFTILYKNKMLDYESSGFPIKNTDRFFIYSFNPFSYEMFHIKWDVFNFEEKKGIFSRLFDKIQGKKNSDFFGQFQKGETLTYQTNFNEPSEYNDHTNYMKPILIIHSEKFLMSELNKQEGKTIIYRRVTSFWDYLANIAALGASFLNIVSKVYSIIYSKNFDNYKIIDNILSKEYKNPIKLDLNINTENDFNSEKHLKLKGIENNSINDDEKSNKVQNMLINGSECSDDIIENEEEDDFNQDEKNRAIIKLPKLRFIDYILNNIYCAQCCIMNKRQKLIDTSNEIIYKYFSVENLLYNQIRFENLMKDYNWNNIEMKSIRQNKLIIDLKKYRI